MSDSKPNVRFNYLYRDASNYKNYGTVVFQNPNKLSLDQIIQIIQLNLIDHEFFKHDLLHIPGLYFSAQNIDDHCWHEFESVENTDDPATDERSIDELLSTFTLNRSLVQDY